METDCTVSLLSMPLHGSSLQIGYLESGKKPRVQLGLSLGFGVVCWLQQGWQWPLPPPISIAASGLVALLSLSTQGCFRLQFLTWMKLLAPTLCLQQQGPNSRGRSSSPRNRASLFHHFLLVSWKIVLMSPALTGTH